MLEKCVKNRLYEFLENHLFFQKTNLVLETIKAHQKHLRSLVSYIYEKLDEGNYVISIFLDIKKAFDCVNHELPLNKFEKYGRYKGHNK